MEEGTLFDRKSLRTVLGRTADFEELARDCVAFANSKGGCIHIGIEDDQTLPPSTQQIEQTLANKIVRRVNELSTNVFVTAQVVTAENCGQYINLRILPSTSSIASTTKGGYFFRDDDSSRPLLPDELSRLMNDKPSYCWETKVSLKYRLADCDAEKKNNLLAALRASDRVSDWLGTRTQRTRLLYSPVVQYIKYDEDGNKINKHLWDDYSLNPMELLDSIWNTVPEWRYPVHCQP